MLDHLSAFRRRPWSPTKTPLRPPSPRDLEIYKRVRIWNHYQWEVAADLKIHYSRVSQIVKRVESWLAAGGSPTDPHLKNALAERRLSRSLQKLRLLRAVELATAALHADSRPITETRRRIVVGAEVWREESQADAPSINLFALQNYVTAVKALEAFENSEDKETDAKPEQITSQETLRALVDLLCRFRIEAEAAGRVDRTGDIFGLVVTTLQNLLGPNVIQHRAPPSEARAQFALNLSATSETSATTYPTQPSVSDEHKTSERGGGGPNLSAGGTTL